MGGRKYPLHIAPTTPPGCRARIAPSDDAWTPHLVHIPSGWRSVGAWHVTPQASWAAWHTIAAFTSIPLPSTEAQKRGPSDGSRYEFNDVDHLTCPDD